MKEKPLDHPFSRVFILMGKREKQKSRDQLINQAKRERNRKKKCALGNWRLSRIEIALELPRMSFLLFTWLLKKLWIEYIQLYIYESKEWDAFGRVYIHVISFFFTPYIYYTYVVRKLFLLSFLIKDIALWSKFYVYWHTNEGYSNK